MHKYRVKSRQKYDQRELLTSCAIQQHLSSQLKSERLILPPISRAPRNNKALAKKINKLENKDLEDMYKLYQYKSKLSLGQRMGLYPCPAPPLSNADWEAIEAMSKGREESVCAICLEQFKLDDQTILSCSHVFHKACLSAFERHSRQKTCPICRKESYEKRHYKHNQEKYKLLCIVNIQRHIRGFLSRKRFYEYMITRPTKEIGSTRLRRRVLGYKLYMASKRQHMANKRNAEQIDQLMNKIKKEQAIYAQKLETTLVDAQVQQSKNNRQIQELMKIKNNKGQSDESQEQEAHWQHILQKIEHEDTLQQEECSICLTALLRNKGNVVYVLDCSHKYHVHCLNALERYDMESVKRCPMCRHENYSKRTLQLNK